MREAVILSAVRLPTGKFQGALKSFSAPQLGAMVVKEAVARAGIPPEAVNEVILGNVVSAGLGQAPARQAAIHAGLPPKVAALTINKVCGSGLKAVMLAAQAVATGDAEVVVAGGMESMSNCRREEQDRYALESHQRAVAAARAGRFRDEILPVPLPGKKGAAPQVLAADEPPREDTSLEALGKLKPAFREGGTVTAGNAPGVNDGAAALVVTSAEKARALGRTPLARIVAQATSGLEPSLVLMTPVDAMRQIWEKSGWSPDSVDLVELNEAFAVQAVAVIREARLDPAKVNVHGGAVALGHAIGASGARVLTTLLHALKQRGLKRGVATLCLGGGNGVALAVEAQ
jgi:acetyl-CoA C-acetyltransferase